MGGRESPTIVGVDWRSRRSEPGHSVLSCLPIGMEGMEERKPRLSLWTGIGMAPRPRHEEARTLDEWMTADVAGEACQRSTGSRKGFLTKALPPEPATVGEAEAEDGWKFEFEAEAKRLRERRRRLVVLR